MWFPLQWKLILQVEKAAAGRKHESDVPFVESGVLLFLQKDAVHDARPDARGGLPAAPRRPGLRRCFRVCAFAPVQRARALGAGFLSLTRGCGGSKKAQPAPSPVPSAAVQGDAHLPVLTARRAPCAGLADACAHTPADWQCFIAVAAVAALAGVATAGRGLPGYVVSALGSAFAFASLEVANHFIPYPIVAGGHAAITAILFASPAKGAPAATHVRGVLGGHVIAAGVAIGLAKALPEAAAFATKTVIVTLVIGAQSVAGALHPPACALAFVWATTKETDPMKLVGPLIGCAVLIVCQQVWLVLTAPKAPAPAKDKAAAPPAAAPGAPAAAAQVFFPLPQVSVFFLDSLLCIPCSLSGMCGRRLARKPPAPRPRRQSKSLLSLASPYAVLPSRCALSETPRNLGTSDCL